ncbi:Hypothetical protein Minf_0960 [Methylacidiphilum infernorum V4]|uniref:Uncharacterized protein n=1 Tax=Methylacidiphilum infernorum (isolate V4) TaxID=481448 RepID=B3DUL2_METI4|nr:Hypothetical protein Minf_0960 [Methylacidiphilum infernorum V4]
MYSEEKIITREIVEKDMFWKAKSHFLSYIPWLFIAGTYKFL